RKRSISPSTVSETKRANQRWAPPLLSALYAMKTGSIPRGLRRANKVAAKVPRILVSVAAITRCMCTSSTSLCRLWFDSGSLRPEVVKDDRGNGEADQNANDAVADFIKIGVGCVALEHAEEKSERDLETGVTDAFASGRDPTGNCADCGNEHDQRSDRFHVW